MDEPRLVWSAGHADLAELTQIIDLLDMARDVIKTYPDAALTIDGNFERQTIVISTLVDAGKFAELKNSRIPNVDALQTITLDCSGGG